MAYTGTEFNDPAEYAAASCDPELPHDTAEDIFLDARQRVSLPPALAQYAALLDWWSLALFREFWRDWQEQEGGGQSSVAFGDEAAIRLLQALTKSHTRRTAMRAECYMAVINRVPEPQTKIAARYGVSKAAVSKIIVGICDELNMAPARHMKSDAARGSYRERALRVHRERKSRLCKTQKTETTSLFSKFWKSTQNGSKPPMLALHN